MSTIILSTIPSHDASFQLTSTIFNEKLGNIDDIFSSLALFVNNHVDGVGNYHNSSDISYNNAGYSWLVATDVQEALNVLASRSGPELRLFDSLGGSTRDHRHINHNGVAGVPGITASQTTELIGSGDTALHKHGAIYATHTQLESWGVSPDTQRMEIVFESDWEPMNASDTKTISHTLAYKPDGVIARVAAVSDGTVWVEMPIPGSYDEVGDFIGITVRTTTSGATVTSGSSLYKDPLLEITTGGYIKLYLYRFK